MNSASGASAAPPFGANRSMNWRGDGRNDAELGASLGLRHVAIGRAVALPSLENLRMLRHPGAVVVFDLVVDGHDGEECFIPGRPARVAARAYCSIPDARQSKQALANIFSRDRDLPAAIFALENGVVILRKGVFKKTSHSTVAIDALRNEHRLVRHPLCCRQ